MRKIALVGLVDVLALPKRLNVIALKRHTKFHTISSRQLYKKFIILIKIYE